MLVRVNALVKQQVYRAQVRRAGSPREARPVVFDMLPARKVLDMPGFLG